MEALVWLTETKPKGAVDLAVDTTLKKKQKLRNNEYYNTQDVFDKLHAQSVEGKTFRNLTQIISAENNILLAYRNIKSNKGSKTKGADGRTTAYLLMAGQNCKCGVTLEPLDILNMECHHKKPKEQGGTDNYDNLVWLKTEAHRLIHATQSEAIAKHLATLNLDESALKKVNSLRLSAGNFEIVTNAV